MNKHGSRNFTVLRIYAIALMLMGVSIAVGGAKLLALGGSSYYLIAGLMTVIACVQICRRRESGIWIYAAVLLGTIAWAFWEVGMDGWALAPRLTAPLVLGAVLFLLWSWVWRSTVNEARRPPIATRWLRLSAVAAVVIAAAIGIGDLGHKARSDLAVDPAYRAGMNGPWSQGSPALPGARTDVDWASYGADLANTHYSPLTQINAGNVAKMKVSWTYRVGPTPAGHGPPDSARGNAVGD
jgi:glucose dehydrogenase